MDAATAANVIRYLTGWEPMIGYQCETVNGELRILSWPEGGPPRPTDTDLDAAASSTEYLEWRRTHGGDPAATLERETVERAVAPSVPLEIALAAVGDVATYGFHVRDTAFAALVAAYDADRAARGLPPCGVPVVSVTAEEAQQLWSQAVARRLGLAAMPYEGE